MSKIKPLRIILSAILAALLIAAPVQAQSPDEITAQSLFGNWQQYVPGDQPLGLACGPSSSIGGGPANIGVDKGFSLGTDPMERRVNLVRALMRDYQLTAEQGSGIVGNFMHESGGKHVPPDVNEGGRVGPPAFRGGYGWAQWTGPRQRQFIAFVTPPQNDYMASASVNATDAANYAWLKQELNTGYKSTITQLKTKTTPEDAAVSFEDTFEKAGVPALGPRMANARQVFNELNGGGVGAPAPGVPGQAGGGTSGCPPVGGGGSGTIVGEFAFPLIINKSGIKNRGMFRNNTADQGGHPYIAYDILVNPGTPVAAFQSGTVTSISQDRCPGRLISVFSPQSNMTVSYLHNDFNNHVQKGAAVNVGQQIAVVGPASAGCGIPHLHIDAASGDRRPGCSRLNCPAANRSKFIDIGPQLFTTFQALPE